MNFSPDLPRAPAEHPPSATSLGRATGGIEYTRTRTLPVDREYLRSRYLIAGFEPCAYVDAFKVLRTRVLQKMRENGWTTLGVTSPNAGAGKSLVAANLALSLALKTTLTVLLVDADLRGPELHEFFGIEPELGLGDHLLDGTPVEDLLVHPRGIDRFVLLPSPRPVPASAELLAAPRTAHLVQELKQRYADRIVIFDLPHLQTADALAFAPLADALLVVVGAGSTGQTELAEAMEQLQGIPLVGTVLNNAELAQAG